MKPEHFEDFRVSAKLSLLFEILKECEQIGDKLYVSSNNRTVRKNNCIMPVIVTIVFIIPQAYILAIFIFSYYYRGISQTNRRLDSGRHIVGHTGRS